MLIQRIISLLFVECSFLIDLILFYWSLIKMSLIDELIIFISEKEEKKKLNDTWKLNNIYSNKLIKKYMVDEFIYLAKNPNIAR